MALVYPHIKHWKAGLRIPRLTFAHIRELPRTAPLLGLLIRIGSLLALYLLLEWWLLRLTRLSPESYEQAFLLAELGKRLANLSLTSLIALALFVSAAVGGFRSRSIGPTWSAFDHGPTLRRLIFLICAVLAWSYTTYDYNFYFNQGHDLDRLLLLLLLPLICWRPVLIFAFLLVLLPIFQQFDDPIGGYSWAEQILPVRILILFAAALLMLLLTRRLRSSDCVFLLFCLVASHYWVPGLGKLQLNWAVHDHVYYLLPATYANGWLGFLDPGTISTLTQSIAWFNGPMKLATLMVECGALLCLWRRTLLRAFLIAAVALHLGVFLVSGICFWKWMVLNVGLLALFLRRSSPPLPIFTREHVLLSVVLIGSAPFWVKAVNLSWYDARVSYTYRFEAVGESGRVYTLPPAFFAPYDYQFTLSGFSYLSDQPNLGITWGATMNRTIAEALVKSTSAEQIRGLEAELGRSRFNPQKSAVLEHFIRRFVGNQNTRETEPSWWTWLQAPPQLWTFSEGNAYKRQERITRVNIYQVTSLYDDTAYREIRKVRIREIDLALGARERERNDTDSSHPPGLSRSSVDSLSAGP